MNTSHYKYLGIEIDSSLNLNSHFEKRASSRLRLLGKLRDYLDLTSAKAIYRSLILFTFTYNGSLHLKTTDTQCKRLASFHDRSLRTTHAMKCNQLKMLIKSVHVSLYANVSTKIFVILFKVALKSMTTKCVQETTNVW